MPDYSKTWLYYIQINDKRYYGHSTNKYVSEYQSAHRCNYRKALKKGNVTRKLWKDLQQANIQPDDLRIVFIESV